MLVSRKFLRYLVNIAGCSVSISFLNTWLPHRRGGSGKRGQLAERAQVQIPRVARARVSFYFNQVNTVDILALFLEYWPDIRVAQYLNSAEETIAE